VASAGGELGLASTGCGKRVERERHVERLAVGASLVRLEAVAEASVGVAISQHRVDDAFGRGLLEEGREQALSSTRASRKRNARAAAKRSARVIATARRV
jgi:hypothetical protein